MQTDTSFTATSELNPQPAAPEPNGSPAVTLAQAPDASASLHRLVNSQTNMALQPVAAAQAPAVIEAKPLQLTVQEHKARRKGKIASLPKIHRDMVNRMLSNGAPYKNIKAALERTGFLVSERNISNWATGGGHLEWELEQDLAIQNRHDQDHLVDKLRREDASELSEVGLQAAATRLSQILVQKLSSGENIEANLPKYSQMVGLLRGITATLVPLQKNRDDSLRTLGRAYDVNRVKNEDQKTILELEQDYTYPEDAEERRLGLPAEIPLLPVTPTSHRLEKDDQMEANARRQAVEAIVLKALGKSHTSAAPKPQPPASPAPTPPNPGPETPPLKPGNGALQ
jgi:hypothetical protein